MPATKKKRETKKIQKLVVRDRSCSPGVWLCEGLADGDWLALAVLEAWS